MNVQFKTAKIAKEKGFKEQCFKYYNDKGVLTSATCENGSSTDTDFSVEFEDLLDNFNEDCFRESICSAPQQSELQKWLREKHKIHIQVHLHIEGITATKYNLKYYVVGIKIRRNPDELFRLANNESFEDTLEEGLLHALTLI